MDLEDKFFEEDGTLVTKIDNYMTKQVGTCYTLLRDKKLFSQNQLKQISNFYDTAIYSSAISLSPSIIPLLDQTSTTFEYTKALTFGGMGTMSMLLKKETESKKTPNPLSMNIKEEKEFHNSIKQSNFFPLLRTSLLGLSTAQLANTLYHLPALNYLEGVETLGVSVALGSITLGQYLSKYPKEPPKEKKKEKAIERKFGIGLEPQLP